MPCLPIPWTAWILLIVSHSSLVEGAWSCEEYSASHIAHCTH